MAFQPLRLPRIQQGQAIVDATGRPSAAFVTQINNVFKAIEVAYNGITDALNAAGVAQAAADAANAAAVTATAAAVAAQSTADGISADQALINSYISPESVLTASPSTITIAAHTRYYADGTSKAVSGGTVPATGHGDTDYVSYSDPTHVGGVVTFVATTPDQPPQTNGIHVVGAVTIPTTGSASGGGGPKPPGYVQP